MSRLRVNGIAGRVYYLNSPDNQKNEDKFERNLDANRENIPRYLNKRADFNTSLSRWNAGVVVSQRKNRAKQQPHKRAGVNDTESTGKA